MSSDLDATEKRFALHLHFPVPIRFIVRGLSANWKNSSRISVLDFPDRALLGMQMLRTECLFFSVRVCSA